MKAIYLFLLIFIFYIFYNEYVPFKLSCYLKESQGEEGEGMPFWISRVLANIELGKGCYLFSLPPTTRQRLPQSGLSSEYHKSQMPLIIKLVFCRISKLYTLLFLFKRIAVSLSAWGNMK